MPLVGELRIFQRGTAWNEFAAVPTNPACAPCSMSAGSTASGGSHRTRSATESRRAPKCERDGWKMRPCPLEILLTSDEAVSRDLAAKLDSLNQARKDEQRRVTGEAVMNVIQSGMHKKSVIMVAAERWNTGVVGIVAGKLVEQFHRPANRDRDRRGWCRGKEADASRARFQAFDLFQGISLCRDLAPGHLRGSIATAVAGMSLTMDRFDEFRDRLTAHADSSAHRSRFPAPPARRCIRKPCARFDHGLLEEWEASSNRSANRIPQPSIAARGVLCVDASRMGKDFTPSQESSRRSSTPP